MRRADGTHGGDIWVEDVVDAETGGVESRKRFRGGGQRRGGRSRTHEEGPTERQTKVLHAAKRRAVAICSHGGEGASTCDSCSVKVAPGPGEIHRSWLYEPVVVTMSVPRRVTDGVGKRAATAATGASSGGLWPGTSSKPISSLVYAEVWTNVPDVLCPSGAWHSVPLERLTRQGTSPAHHVEWSGSPGGGDDAVEFAGMLMPVAAGEWRATFRVGVGGPAKAADDVDSEASAAAAAIASFEITSPIQTAKSHDDDGMADSDFLDAMESSEVEEATPTPGEWVWAGDANNDCILEVAAPSVPSDAGAITAHTEAAVAFTCAFGEALRVAVAAAPSTRATVGPVPSYSAWGGHGPSAAPVDAPERVEASGPLVTAVAASLLAVHLAAASRRAATSTVGPEHGTISAEEAAPLLAGCDWLASGHNARSLFPLILRSPALSRSDDALSHAASAWLTVAQAQNGVFSDPAVLRAIARGIPKRVNFYQTAAADERMSPSVGTGCSEGAGASRASPSFEIMSPLAAASTSLFSPLALEAAGAGTTAPQGGSSGGSSGGGSMTGSSGGSSVASDGGSSGSPFGVEPKRYSIAAGGAGAGAGRGRPQRGFGDVLHDMALHVPARSRLLILLHDYSLRIGAFGDVFADEAEADSVATPRSGSNNPWAGYEVIVGKTPNLVHEERELRLALFASAARITPLNEIPSRVVTRTVDALRFAKPGSLTAFHTAQMLRLFVDGSPRGAPGGEAADAAPHSWSTPAALMAAHKRVFAAIHAAICDHIAGVTARPPSWLDSWTEDAVPDESSETSSRLGAAQAAATDTGGSSLRPLLLFVVDALHNRVSGRPASRRAQLPAPTAAMAAGSALSCNPGGCGSCSAAVHTKTSGGEAAPSVITYCGLMQTSMVPPLEQAVGTAMRPVAPAQSFGSTAPARAPQQAWGGAGNVGGDSGVVTPPTPAGRAEEPPWGGSPADASASVFIHPRALSRNGRSPVDGGSCADGESSAAGRRRMTSRAGRSHRRSPLSKTATNFLPGTAALLSLCPQGDDPTVGAGLWIDMARSVASAAVKLCPYNDPDYEAVLSAAAQLAGSCPLARAAVLRKLLQRPVVGTNANEVLLVNFLAVVLKETVARGDIVLPRLASLICKRLVDWVTCERVDVVSLVLNLMVNLAHKLTELLGSEAHRCLKTALLDSAKRHWHSELRAACTRAACALYADVAATAFGGGE